MIVLLAAGAALAHEKHEKNVERKPAPAPTPAPAPKPPQEAERRDVRPPQPAQPLPRPDSQRRVQSPSHQGSLHYAEQRTRREEPRHVDVHEVERRSVTPRIDLDVRTRAPISYGTTIRSVPASAREISVRNRNYYFYNDHYFRPIRYGTEVRYVATRPPVGAYLRFLPNDFQLEILGGRRFYVAGDTYYQESVYEGEPSYVVVEPPLGATLSILPDDYQMMYVGGQRLVCVDDYYYRPVMRRGTVVYVHVPAPQRRIDEVHGIVNFADRAPIGPDMEISVRLLDISDPGSLPEIVAEQSIAQPDAVPVPFVLRFDADTIDPRHIYAVDADVLYNGEVRWSSRSAVSVLNGRPNTAEVLVEPVR
ncbi:MAG: YbaY family lipoprotein [Deltaproteobacteria bacterium]|nr:YbaY family lipoprotein [Deltaproteobacteria bacterium]